MCAYVDGNIQGLLPAVDLSWQCSLPQDLNTFHIPLWDLVSFPVLIPQLLLLAVRIAQERTTCIASDDRCGMKTGNEAISHKLN